MSDDVRQTAIDQSLSLQLRRSMERNTRLVLALDWYAEQAEAIARYMNENKPEAVTAAAVALSLDGGQRAKKAKQGD